MLPIDSEPGLPAAPSGNAWGLQLVRRLSILLRQIATRTNTMFPKDGSEGLKEYTQGPPDTRPVPTKGQIIYVSDGAAGGRYQASHGNAWVNIG